MQRTLALIVGLLGAGGAGAPVAGQFVDPSGDWRTLHTPHFRVHFRSAHRRVAQEAAREAERAYALLATELRPPRGKVDIALTDDADVSNGLATVFPSNRLTMLLTPPGSEPELQHYDSWLRLLTVHELSHMFHLDQAGGLWGVLQGVFGRAPGLFPNVYQPAWVSEGLATYYESRFTEGGRAHGGLHRQVTGAEVAAGVARSPWTALSFSRWPEGLAPYAYGSQFFDYVGRVAGDSAVPRFIAATSKQLIPYRVGRPLRRSGAVPHLGSAWAERFPRNPRPPARAAGGEEILADRLWLDPSPRVARDGRHLAYLRHDGKDEPRLVIADAVTLAPRRRHVVTGGVSFDWADDTLLVAQLEYVSRWHLRSDLYRWAPDGSWRRATRGARIVEPRGGGARTAWVTLSTASRQPNVPAGDSGGEGDAGVTWGEVVPSPDGRRMAATRHHGGRWTLVGWPTTAPERRETLLEADGIVADPVWGSDGALYFVWDPAGLPQVYRLPAEGGTPVAVTAAPHGARSPAVLPDGTLLYSTFRGGGWALVRARPGSAPAGRRATPPAFEPAAPVDVRETGYAAFPSLWPRFWLPTYASDGSGSFVGAVTAGGDAIGRFNYVALAAYAWDRSRANGAVSLVSRLLGDPTLDLTAQSEWSHAGVTASLRDVSALETDAGLGITFERRGWRSAASLRLAAEYEGLRFSVIPDSAIPGRDLVGGSVTLGIARYANAPLAVSPQHGYSWALTYRRREAQGSALWRDEVRVRGALYLPFPDLGTFSHPVLAVRGAAATRQGPLAGRFGVGGDASAEFDYLTASVEGGSQLFFVRGYPEGWVAGRRAVAATAELRVPLLLVGRSLGHLPVGADMLSLSLFSDAGDAWDSGGAAGGRLTRLHSVGAELVGDLIAGYNAGLRLRFGVAKPLEPLDPRVYVAFGSAF